MPAGHGASVDVVGEPELVLLPARAALAVVAGLGLPGAGDGLDVEGAGEAVAPGTEPCRAGDPETKIESHDLDLAEAPSFTLQFPRA
jgi:hypothetical protein